MEKFVLNRRHLLLGAGGLCVGATGLLSTVANAASSLAAAKSDGRIRVGFANEAPYAFASPEGKLTGLMPDVIGYIMKELGVPELEGVLTDFGGLIPGLLAKRFDILGAGLYVTPVRCKQVAASNPQYVVTESIAVKKGNPKNLHSYADIAKDDGVKIGTLAGSINAQYLAAAKVPTSRIVLFPDLPSAIAGLQGGRVDGVTMSIISLQDVLRKTNDANLELVQPFEDPLDEKGKPSRGYGSAWFRREDEELVAAYNGKLAEIRDSGKLLELMEPYGFTAAQVPPADVTSAELCQA
jgi:polar amino acid transport system substrate-binding protein